MTITVLNAMLRPLLGGRLPDWVQPRYFTSTEELLELAPLAEIGWFDSFDWDAAPKAVAMADRLKWFNTLAAGVDQFPLDGLRNRGAIVTNGAGLGAIPIAEFVVMGMLTLAKDWRTVVRAQERHEWLDDAPGKQELFGSKALVLGAGSIGKQVAHVLRGFGVEVATVRRTPQDGDLGMDQWRARLSEFDWVIVTVPSTPDTAGMIGAAELAAMKRSSSILNFARGAVIDQAALMDALRSRRIASAFLDVTDPEPLPPEHELWSIDNCHISMHLSGRAQTRLFIRAADRFIRNLEQYHKGEALESVVDMDLGY